MVALSQKNLIEAVVAAVEQRLGQGHSELGRLVAEELSAALPEITPQEAPTERVVITANGRNRPGIVARLATTIDQFGGDIRDMSQTIVADYFTMLLVADIGGATREGARFADLRHSLQQVGHDLGIHVVVLHDDILSSMHSV